MNSKVRAVRLLAGVILAVGLVASARLAFASGYCYLEKTCADSHIVYCWCDDGNCGTFDAPKGGGCYYDCVGMGNNQVYCNTEPF